MNQQHIGLWHRGMRGDLTLAREQCQVREAPNILAHGVHHP